MVKTPVIVGRKDDRRDPTTKLLDGVTLLELNQEPTLGAHTHSWTPIPLTKAAGRPPEPPTIGGFVYPGRLHIFSGEPESSKSMVALILCVEEIRAGRSVLVIDFENGAPETLARLRALGLTDDQIDASLVYVAPEEPLTQPEILADVQRLITELRPSLVVLDAYTASLVLHRCDPYLQHDIERHAQTVLAPLRASGAAVVVIDHVVKDKEKRGRYPIGSERKLALADVHLAFKLGAPFGRGRSGRVSLEVQKDRPGYLPRPTAAEVELTSVADTGAITWTIDRGAEAKAGSSYRLEGQMERVSRYVEKQSKPIPVGQIEKQVSGKAEHTRQAIRRLVAEDYFTEKAGPRKARLVESRTPFHGHPVPTSSVGENADLVPSSTPALSREDGIQPTPSQFVPISSDGCARASVAPLRGADAEGRSAGADVRSPSTLSQPIPHSAETDART